MQFKESNRRELIQKLKKIKDPRERDRILWVLSGQEEDVFHSAPSPAPWPKPVLTSRPAPHRPEPERPSPSKVPDLRNMPQINIGAKRMIGFVVPAFFAIFGLVRIGQAVLNYIASQDIETEITGLVTGGIFLIIGLAGIFRAMQPPQIKQDEVS
jgi:hypothetical protein